VKRGKRAVGPPVADDEGFLLGCIDRYGSARMTIALHPLRHGRAPPGQEDDAATQQARGGQLELLRGARRVTQADDGNPIGRSAGLQWRFGRKSAPDDLRCDVTEVSGY
jgi:hypothetical protein